MNQSKVIFVLQKSRRKAGYCCFKSQQQTRLEWGLLLWSRFHSTSKVGPQLLLNILRILSGWYFSGFSSWNSCLCRSASIWRGFPFKSMYVIYVVRNSIRDIASFSLNSSNVTNDASGCTPDLRCAHSSSKYICLFSCNVRRIFTGMSSLNLPSIFTFY